MKRFRIFLLLAFMATNFAAAQNTEDEGLNTNTAKFDPLVKVATYFYQGDSVQYVELDKPITVTVKQFKSEKERQEYNRLVRRIKRTLPIAKEIRGIVIETYQTLATIPTPKERKKHLKQVEKDIKAEYTPRMKKLTLTEGKILIKLVNRECKSSSYELVQAFLGPIRAGFYQAFAWVFKASLKKEYDPEGEDHDIEIIIKQIEAGQL